jgi:hypothetical protein
VSITEFVDTSATIKADHVISIPQSSLAEQAALGGGKRRCSGWHVELLPGIGIEVPDMILNRHGRRCR